MRILLVGASGQVGWELARILAGQAELTLTTRRPEELVAADLPHGGKAIDARAVVPLDLTDEQTIRQVARDARPDWIVNAAAYTAVDRAENEPELADALNHRAPGILAEEAARCGAGLIHYSTDYVFNGSGTRPWQESDPPAPLNVYGRTKLAGEQAVARSCRAHWILRTSWVYGIHGANFVKTMLRLGCQREELAVVADQVGAPTSARVIAAATAQMLAKCHDTAPARLETAGIYHLACRGSATWNEFAQEIFRWARQLHVPLKIQAVRPITSADYPTPAARPKNSRLDLSHLRQTFGIETPDWPTALADVIAPLCQRWQAEQDLSAEASGR